MAVLSYLSINDVYYSIGCVNRSGWLTYLRERSLRRSLCSNMLILIPKLDLNHDKVLLVSYPRSGNSMLRQQLESLTGIYTGSDSRPNRTLTSYLLERGYRGMISHGGLCTIVINLSLLFQR